MRLLRLVRRSSQLSGLTLGVAALWFAVRGQYLIGALCTLGCAVCHYCYRMYNKLIRKTEKNGEKD